MSRIATVPLFHRIGLRSFLMESSGLSSHTIFLGVRALRILIIRGAMAAAGIGCRGGEGCGQ